MLKRSQKISIPPLVSGGVMLSYRCSNECKHCLYRCSPRQPDEWMTMEMAERIFSALADEKNLHSIHIAGGEPFLKMDLLDITSCIRKVEPECRSLEKGTGCAAGLELRKPLCQACPGKT